MNCDTVEKRLDDYVDGELTEEDQRSVDAHLETCLTCNRALRQLRSLVERARRLPTEIEPETKLWPRIESRIAVPPTAAAAEQRRQSSAGQWRWIPLVAAALLLIAVTLPLTLLQLRRNPVAEPPVADLVATSNESPGAATTAMLARSEDGVLLPRTDLLETLEKKRDILPPETLAIIEDNAGLIDQAIAEVRAALGESPDSRQLELLLAARYQQEVDLLKKVNRV